MSEILATADDGYLRVRLARSEHPVNPRHNTGNLVHVITIDTHLDQYEPVDRHGGPLADIWKRLASNRWRGIELFTRYVSTMHDGIVLESAPENGPRSLWYMTGQEMYELDFGILSEGYVEAEKEEYEAWLSGDVWDFVVEKKTHVFKADEPYWKPIESRSSLYGGPYARDMARSALRRWAERSAGTS